MYPDRKMKKLPVTHPKQLLHGNNQIGRSWAYLLLFIFHFEDQDKPNIESEYSIGKDNVQTTSLLFVVNQFLLRSW